VILKILLYKTTHGQFELRLIAEDEDDMLHKDELVKAIEVLVEASPVAKTLLPAIAEASAKEGRMFMEVDITFISLYVALSDRIILNLIMNPVGDNSKEEQIVRQLSKMETGVN